MSNKGYFISPGGHLRSSQNDLDLPSDPIDCGSSTPDVERSSTTMTRRSFRRGRELDGNDHGSGDDLYSEVPSIGEAIALSHSNKARRSTRRSSMPSSPPSRLATVRKKQRPVYISVDGPKSTPPEESNQDNHAEQHPHESITDNDYNNDVASTLPEPEDDDDYELPVSDIESNDSFISEVKRPRGKNKPAATRSRTTQRKPRAAAKKTSGKANEQKGQPKKRRTASKSTTTSNRLKGPKGGSKDGQGVEPQDIPTSIFPLARHINDAPLDFIPDSQPSQTSPQQKSMGQTARVAKKPFYDESTGHQRKHIQATESSSSREPNSATRVIEPMVASLEKPSHFPSKEAQVPSGKKRALPYGKQTGLKRPRINGNGNPSISASAAPKNITSSGQMSVSSSKKIVEEDSAKPDTAVESTSWLFDNEQDPWEISTTPMSKKAPNNVHQVDKSEHRMHEPSQSKADSLHAMQEPSQDTSSKSKNNNKRSHVHYGSRRNSKRIMQRVSKPKGVTVEKGSSPEHESDSQHNEPRLPSIIYPPNPPSSPRGKRASSPRRQVPDATGNPTKMNKDDAPAKERGLNISDSTEKQPEHLIIVSTDHSSESAGFEDEVLKLPNETPVAPMSPSWPVYQKPPSPEEATSPVINRPMDSAITQPIRSHDGSHSQTLTIQGHSPITSPRNCPESQEMEITDILHYHPGHRSQKQPLEPNTLENLGKKVQNSPVHQPHAREAKLLGNGRPFQARPREENLENQASGVNPDLDETKTRNEFCSWEHEAHIPRKDVTPLQYKPSIRGCAGHSVVTPLGSPHATRRMVGFTRHVEKGPIYNQVQGRGQNQRYGDPFRPSPPEVTRTDTQALHSPLKRQFNFNSQDQWQENLPRYSKYILNERNLLKGPDNGMSRSLYEFQNSSSAMNMGHHSSEVLRLPSIEPVQFHPKSVTFASRASQTFEDAKSKPRPRQKATLEQMDQPRFIPSQQPTAKKSDRVLALSAIGQKTRKAKQPSKWEQAVDVACSGVVDTMHQISVEILEHLRTREENLESVLTEYKRNGTKITAQLTARQDTEQLSAAKEFRQVCLETASLYKEASHNIHTIQDRAPVHDRGDGVAQWKKQTKQIEQAILTSRQELSSL